MGVGAWGACAYSQQRELKQREHQLGLGCASECASSGSLPRWLRPVTHAAAASPRQPASERALRCPGRSLHGTVGEAAEAAPGRRQMAVRRVSRARGRLRVRAALCAFRQDSFTFFTALITP